MKKVILMAALAAAVMMISCKTGECGGVPHDPDDITGEYTMNYNMYIDGEAVNAGPSVGYVFLLKDGDRYTVDVHPHRNILTPIPALGRTITTITMSAVEPGGTVGDYTVEWSGEAVVSCYDDGEGENVAAATTMTGTIDRKPATRCSPVIHTPDEYHNLAMTVEVAIPAGEGATRNMRIEITGL